MESVSTRGSSGAPRALPIKTHVGPWTFEQKVHDHDTVHLAMSAKYAAASLATPHCTAHKAKGPLRHINCVGHLNFDSEAELTQAITELYQNFFGPGQMFAVMACPNSRPNTAVDVVAQFKLPSQETPLFNDKALPYMTLDMTTRPYIAPQFREDHPARALRLVEIESNCDDKICEDFTRVVFASFYAAGTPTEAMIQEHTTKVKHIKRNVAPFFHSFVAYEGEQPVAAGSCLLCPTTGIAGIFEIGCMPECRSKGYGAKLFSHIVEFVLQAGYVRVCLSATDYGRPVYHRQGFDVVNGAIIHFFSPKQ